MIHFCAGYVVFHSHLTILKSVFFSKTNIKNFLYTQASGNQNTSIMKITSISVFSLIFTLLGKCFMFLEY